MGISLKGRSLVTWLDYSPDEIRYLLDLSKQVKKEKHQGIINKRFDGKTVALIFEKRSTRTRCSFETAVGEEGGHPVFLSTSDIHLGEKESVEDTARVLGRMFDAILFRGFKQSTVYALAKYSGIPVYNGLTDDYHPTQVLADIMTLEEAFGDVRGKKLVYSGDGRNNVATSLIVICSKLGVDISVITPPELYPSTEIIEKCKVLAKTSGAKIVVSNNINDVKGAHAIYTDVWVSMGEQGVKEQRTRLLRPFQVNKAMFEKTGNDDTIFLHCLPAVRGEEVTAEIIDGSQSRVWDEAENRKHAIKAIMLATIK